MAKTRVASTVDVPVDRGLVVEIGGKSVTIFRHKGELHAVDDTCPHKGGSLHEGSVEEYIVSCPWHRWRFDVRSGVCPVNPRSRIEVYRLLVEEGEIFIELE